MTWPEGIENPHDEFEQGWPTVDGWHTDAATGSDRALLHDVHHAAIDALLAYIERLENIVQDVATAGIVADDPRLGYVEVQVAPATFEAAKAITKRDT